MVVNGSRLGRHLDIEEASLAGRRILGATGPFGRVDDVGLYATLLPSRSNGIEDVISALTMGLGVCVELRKPLQTPPPPKRSRRRRRPRRKNSKGTGQSRDTRR